MHYEQRISIYSFKKGLNGFAKINEYSVAQVNS